MPETIITKRCCHCKQIKSIDEFCKNVSMKDGLCVYCKICNYDYVRRYAKTEVGKESGRRRTQRYRQTEKGKAIGKRYTEKYCIANPEKRKAKDVVHGAVRARKLPRPDTFKCDCGEQAKEYHHHKGYAPEHWLDVVPVCVPCHKKIHTRLSRVCTVVQVSVTN